MNSLISFNISFIPRERNKKKADSLIISTSLFNLDDLQSHNTFQVKRIFRPLVLDNQDYLQVFENDEELDEFFVVSSDVVNNFEDHNHTYLSKNISNFESFFTRDDQIKASNLKEEVSTRRVQETQNINIGTEESPRYVNLEIDYTQKEINQYTSLFK
jgi:hypothetical protein